MAPVKTKGADSRRNMLKGHVTVTCIRDKITAHTHTVKRSRDALQQHDGMFHSNVFLPYFPVCVPLYNLSLLHVIVACPCNMFLHVPAP